MSIDMPVSKIYVFIFVSCDKFMTGRCVPIDILVQTSIEN